MSKKLVAISFLALALAACGNTPKKSPDDPSNQGGPGGKASDHSISQNDFAVRCQNTQGGMLWGQDTCLVKHTKSIDNGASGRVPIFAAIAGDYVETIGTAGAVSVLLDGTLLGDIAGLHRLLDKSGQLYFDVTYESEAKASAAVWECFDRFSTDSVNWRKIYCDPNKIPGHY